MTQFVFLAGLPRTGSTLLSSILSQNPAIHAPGNSPVCQLMLDAHESVTVRAREQIIANHKQDYANRTVGAIPHIYHSDTARPIVVDKCRAWTHNQTLVRTYITDTPRVIVMVRPIDQIIRSFIKLWNKNNLDSSGVEWLKPGTEPIMRSLDGVVSALREQQGEYLFVSYDQLVNNTQNTVERIYGHCGWAQFTHDFTHITNTVPEDDQVYGLPGQHEIRSTISPQDNEIILDSRLQAACDRLNTLIADLL